MWLLQSDFITVLGLPWQMTANWMAENKELSSHCSGGWKSQIKVQVRSYLVSEVSGGASAFPVSSSFCWLPQPRTSLACRHDSLCPCLHSISSPLHPCHHKALSLCVRVTLPSSYEDTSYWIKSPSEPTMTALWLNWLHLQGPFSK